jgi:hypothetical protein
MSETRGPPTVRWEPGVGLVDSAGRDVSEAQERKVRIILERGLLSFERVLARDGRNRVVNAYQCAPVPGAKQGHKLRHIMTRRPEGAVRHEFMCDCQWARGTVRSAPGRCCHIIALARTIHGLDDVVTKGGSKP